MIRTQDLLLLAVSFSTMALAVLFPRFGNWFAAAPLFCMMALVFLSMLSISTKSIWQVVRNSRRLIGWLLVGLVIYLFYSRFHSKEQILAAGGHVVERVQCPVCSEYLEHIRGTRQKCGKCDSEWDI